jgi:hypothetical protein
MGRPLDKKKAVLYGRFINAAYTMFERAPTDPHPLPATGEIPEPYELVAWINMSDFVFWWREEPKFYGVIARHQEQKHDFVLAIRGTEGWVEWLDDAMARLVRFRAGSGFAKGLGLDHARVFFFLPRSSVGVLGRGAGKRLDFHLTRQRGRRNGRGNLEDPVAILRV